MAEEIKVQQNLHEEKTELTRPTDTDSSSYNDKTDVYFSGELRLNEILTVEQIFKVSGWLNFFWRDERYNDMFSNTDNINISDNGKNLPITPSAPFENAPSAAVSSNIFYNYNSKTHVMHMAVQLLSAELHERFEMDDFPFDRQFLNLQLTTRIQRTINGNKTGRWNFIGKYPSWIPIGEPYHFEIPIKTAMKDSISAFIMKPAWLDFRDTTNDITGGSLIRLRVVRQPGYYLFHIILPLFLMITCGFTVFSIDIIDIGDRLGFEITLLLTVAAFQYVIAESLPQSSQITHVDIYVALAYAIVTASTITIAISKYLHDNTGTGSDAAIYLDMVIFYGCILVWLVGTMYFVVHYLTNICTKSWEELSEREFTNWKKQNQIDNNENAETISTFKTTGDVGHIFSSNDK